MSSAPQRQVFSLSVGEDVHRLIRQLRLIGGLIVLALLLTILGVASGIVVRLIQPRAGSLSAVGFTGLIGIGALAAGVVALGVSARRAGKTTTLELSVTTYRTGCVIAGVLNFVAGICTVSTVFTNGLAGGLWVPQILIMAINVLGLILAVPRIKHLRKLHYSPTLPYSHI